jgi:WXG100 family type VII secretion target
MPQAIVDPAELRRFAMNLKRFNGELMNQLGVLHSQMLTLSNTWRDQEQQKFTEEFEQTMKVLGRFVEAANQHIPFLLRKADRVEEYLQQK